MSTKETGGPAFPATEDHGLNSGCDIEIHDKILLTLTKHWYRIADSMLEARKS